MKNILALSPLSFGVGQKPHASPSLPHKWGRRSSTTNRDIANIFNALCVAASLSAIALTASAGDAPIRFGVFPNLSARVLLETYQPVADAISSASKQPVELHSAADFKTFYQRTQSGEYDVVLTAPHLAWLAWKEAGYRTLLAYDQPVKGIIVVRQDASFKTLRDLDGKTIAKADPLAIVVMRMEKQLDKVGLQAGRDDQGVAAGSHNNAALQVYQGKADAAILGSLPFHKLPPEVRAGLRIIAETEALPSQVYLLGRRVNPQQEKNIRLGIEQFMQSPAGRSFLDKGGFGGVHRLTRTELNQVATDAQRVKKMLGAPDPQAGSSSIPATGAAATSR